ncbi:MAG: hypothetical protein WCL50_15260, partial [Spirochaetota bacterium]
MSDIAMGSMFFMGEYLHGLVTRRLCLVSCLKKGAPSRNREGAPACEVRKEEARQRVLDVHVLVLQGGQRRLAARAREAQLLLEALVHGRDHRLLERRRVAADEVDLDELE